MILALLRAPPPRRTHQIEPLLSAVILFASVVAHRRKAEVAYV